MFCLLLSNEAVLQKEIIDATKFKASRGRQGLVNFPNHLPPLAGRGQQCFVLDLMSFYQKTALCQLT